MSSEMVVPVDCSPTGIGRGSTHEKESAWYYRLLELDPVRYYFPKLALSLAQSVTQYKRVLDITVKNLPFR